MNRLRVSFTALVVVSLALGGASALNFGDRLGAIDTATDVEDEIDVSVVDVSADGDRLVVTVQIRNPTEADLFVQNAGLRLHNESTERIVAGPGRRLDDGPSRLPAGGTIEATYGLTLSENDRTRATAALNRDARLSMNIGMRHRSAEFNVAAKGLDASGSDGESGGGE